MTIPFILSGAERPPDPLVSVVMPTYGQASFIRRALESIEAQAMAAWELIVVDDASPDRTDEVVAPYLDDERISYRRLPLNVGLGAAVNVGLDAARAPFVAYLPSDDVWAPDHLSTLLAALGSAHDAVLAYAGLRHHYNRRSVEPIAGDGLQAVQILHRRIDDRWLTRRELVTDSLERMFLGRLRARGRFVPTGRVTCEWVDHPGQLHKLVREPVGGINAYRRHFRVPYPLRYHTTTGDAIDEVARYARFRDRPDTPPAADGLRVLLVGELAYNAERVLALEEAGHRLFGYWMPEPYWYNTVGPVPFGHVVDVDADDPREAIRKARPDVVYALLNWQAIPFAARVLRANPGVPFVWHFKEGPFIALEKGTWPDLVELTERADGVVHSSPEMRDWFGLAVPGADDPDRSLVLDGDLPKADWFDRPFARRLSDVDGEIHTVVPGRPIGLHPETVAQLAALGIHLHFYGDFTQGQWKAWIDRARGLAPRHLHLHGTVGPERWVDELSRYDAGWLHVFESRNGGDLRMADWDDLNYPARMSTLAAAGLPMLQRDNAGSVVATQSLNRVLGTGISFRSLEELAALLRDGTTLPAARAAVLRERERFTFDRHASDLVWFFRHTMDRAGHASRRHIRSDDRRCASVADGPGALTRPARR